MAELLGSLLVRLGLESGAFRSGLTEAQKEFRKAQRSFERLGQSMQDIGRNMTLGVTLPLVAMAAKAVQGAQEQAAAMGQVEAALASMGDASGRTAGQLAKAADAMEMRSLFDADVILRQVTANLLTFGNVAGEQFDRAQQAAIDMATRLGGEPQAAAIMLGKALNDPVKGIAALTRVGVQFTDQQKAQIAAMTAAGDAAGAQGVILAEVERQFKGAAAAAADTQPWRQAQVAINQALDKVGEALLPIIPKIADALASIATSFSAMSPTMQNVVLVAVALAAALGPIITVVGALVSLAAPLGAFFTVATGGFAALTIAAAPWLAIAAAVAAVGYLIYANWDKIAPALEEFGAQMSAAVGPEMKALIADISSTLSELWNGPLGDGLRTVVSALGDFMVAWVKTMGPVSVALAQGLIAVISHFVSIVTDGFRTVSRLLSGDFSGAWRAYVSLVDTLTFGLSTKVVNYIRNMVNGIQTWVVDRLGAIWDKVGDKINVVDGWFFRLYDAVVGNSYIPDMVDEIGQNMRRLDVELLRPANDNINATTDAFRQMQRDVRGIMADLFPEVARELERSNIRNTLEEALQAGAITPGAYDAATARLMLPADTLRASIEAVNDMMPDFAQNAETQMVRISRSFAENFQSATDSARRFAASIKSGDILGVFESLLSALDSIGNITGGFKIGGMQFGGARAMGGPVSSGRRYLVGENGPEFFSPRSNGTIIPNNDIGGGGIAQIVPSPYFDVVVDGRVMSAAPGIAAAGSQGAQMAMARRQTRRVA
jgi:hypothetical protein